MQQDSAYTLCPSCKSLNMKRATKCYSCRADLRRATKVAVDRSFSVVPVARYLTPEEIAERDAEEKARREAEAAQRTPRNPVGALLRVVSAPFVIVGTVLRRSAMVLQTGARAVGTGVLRAARVGSSAGSSVAQTGASAGRATARAVGVLGRRAATGTKATGRSAARVASTAARSMARVGSSAVSAVARKGAGAARATTAGSHRAARASAAASHRAAMASAATSRRAAMASAAASRRAAMASAATSRRAAQASLATGRRAAAGAGAAGTALRGMTRDPRLDSRGALGVMLAVSILLILGGVSASWLSVSAAGGAAEQTANMPLLIVGVIVLAIGITWAVGIVRRLRTSNPGPE